MTRSQVAAIAGNLALVVPVALLIGFVWDWVTGTRLPDPAKATATMASLSVLGATPFYAAFTGVLLWMSAVLSGGIENWAVYRRLPEALAHQPRLVHAFGRERMQRAAQWFERNVAGLGGNVALGVLLGMTPVVATFFGLPLDVRHVTLSTGTLALMVAIRATRPRGLSRRRIYRAVLARLIASPGDFLLPPRARPAPQGSAVGP